MSLKKHNMLTSPKLTAYIAVKFVLVGTAKGLEHCLPSPSHQPCSGWNPGLPTCSADTLNNPTVVCLAPAAGLNHVYFILQILTSVSQDP